MDNQIIENLENLENLEENQLSDCDNSQDADIATESEDEQSYHHGEIDQLTLELLMNKNQYQKYISKVDPDKYAKHKAYLADINKYRRRITDITRELLNDPDTQVSTEINSIFEAYTRAIIDHIKCSDHQPYSSDVDPLDDTMFGAMDDPDADEEVASPSKSFWGKERVVRRGHNQSQLQYDMNVFSRSTIPKSSR